MQVKIKLQPNNKKRLNNFIKSNIYVCPNEISYSEYWKEMAKFQMFEINGDSVRLSGKSGFYFPKVDIAWRIKRIVKNPLLILNKIKSFFQNPKYLKASVAFERAMGHHPSTDPDLSKYRVNHLRLKSNYPNVISTFKELRQYHLKWAKSYPNEQIIVDYYLRNLLMPHIKNTDIFLDIGSGNGNFANLLTNEFSPKIFILVDIPESLVNAIIFLIETYLKSNFILPNEIKDKNDIRKIIAHQKDRYTTFIFLTPWQVDLIPSNSINFSSNIASFQEMKNEQIKVYFELIQRVSVNKGLFLCMNRVEKIPVNLNPFIEEQIEEPIRFYEYPWRKTNISLIDEISRLHRVHSEDDIGIRLQAIIKQNNT